jgi:hypothetical protein
LNLEIYNTAIQNAEFTIYDLQGRQVLHKVFDHDSKTINLDQIESGLYIYEIGNEGKILRDKLIIQK